MRSSSMNTGVWRTGAVEKSGLYSTHRPRRSPRRNQMSIMRTALPLVLLTGVLTGCAGLQKTDWPTCAAVGGVTGAAIGATESSAYAGYGALLVGGMAGAYCWVHGDGDEDGDGVPDC